MATESPRRRVFVECTDCRYGDATKRVSLPLPPTLKIMMQRAREIMGGDCEIWHAPSPQGEPAVANYKIRNEADYSLVKNQDILVLCFPDGRLLDILSVGKIFDDLTIYRRDYVEHPITSPTVFRPEDCDESLPDISGLTFKTTYNNHFRGKSLPEGAWRRGVAPTGENFSITSGNTLTGESTYQSHYQSPGLDSANLNDPAFVDFHFPKPWIQSYNSTYRTDFVPHPLTDPSGRTVEGSADLSTGPRVPWRQTEYMDEYVAKTADPWTGNQTAPSFSLVGYGDLKTTYKDAFPHHKTQLIHCEPEMEKAPLS